MASSVVPADTNFSIPRADAVSWTLNVSFPASAVSVDLNDYVVTMTARRDLADSPNATVFVLSTTGGEITIDNVHLNQAHIALDSEDTEDLDCAPPLNRSVLAYDVEIIGPDSKPYTVCRGQIIVVADATRNA